MPRQLLTSESLKETLDAVLIKLEHGTYSSFHPIFETLYYHGFRIQELKSVHQWTILPGEMVSAQTLKGGGARIISLTEFHPLVYQSIQDGVNYIFRTSYDTVERAFQWALPALALEVKTKSIGTHAFRHNRIKQLEAAGYNRPSIKTIFALQNLATVDNYADSEIFKVTR